MRDENLKAVYEQYWNHARHCERETWLFTSIYVIIAAAILAAIGSEKITSEMQIFVTAFGVLLSLLGFFVVYTQRIPFIKFAFIAELIAINEFKIKGDYRRFFPEGDGDYPKGKRITTNDVLSMFYSLLTGAMVYFCIESLEEALKKGRPDIFNTDQGSQFTSNDFTGILLNNGIKISMDSRGRVFDNIFSERLWRSVKYEEVYLKDYRVYAEAYEGLSNYFQLYNNRRYHQSLGYKTPHEVYYGCTN